MIPIIQGAVQHGEIYLSADDSMLLTQDMFEARLGTGVFLDVGWFPEHDSHGEYVLTAFIDPDDLLRDPFVTDDPDEVVRVLHQWAYLFSQPLSYLSSAKTTYGRSRAISYA